MPRHGSASSVFILSSKSVAFLYTRLRGLWCLTQGRATGQGDPALSAAGPELFPPPLSPVPSPVHSGHPLTLIASVVWPCSLLCGVSSISQPHIDILGRITSLFGGTCLVHCGTFSSICGLYPMNSIRVTSYNQECYHTLPNAPQGEKTSFAGNHCDSLFFFIIPPLERGSVSW